MSTKEAPPARRKPGTRVMLPFRVESGVSYGRNTTVLRYEGDVIMLDRSKRRQLYSYDLGFVAADSEACYINPLGAAILQTIQMYVQLEEEYDRMARELEELTGQKSSLEARIATLEHRVTGYENHGGKGKSKGRNGET